MSQVLKFPPKPASPPPALPAVKVAKAARRSLVAITASSVLRAIGSLVFLLLLWLRGPIHGILCLLVAAGMIALIVLWLSSGYARRTEFMLISFGLSFGAFMLAWGYDSLLRWLAPGPLYLT